MIFYPKVRINDYLAEFLMPRKGCLKYKTPLLICQTEKLSGFAGKAFLKYPETVSGIN